MNTKVKKPFYGWVIVIAGMIIMAVSVGVVYNCLSLYIVPICDEFGFSRKAGAAMEAIYSVGIMIIAISSVYLYKRVKIQNTMRIAAVLLSAAYFSYSYASKIWEFYLISIVAACAMWLLAYIPFAIILNNWFHKYSGFVIGLTYMGTGIGGMLFNPLVGLLIDTVGWRGAFSTMSIVLLCTLVPCTLLIRQSPKEKGLKPLGWQDEMALSGEMEFDGIDISYARRTVKFYLLAISIAALNMIGTGFVMTFAAYLSDKAYGIDTASRIMSYMMASLAVGKLALGWLYDKLGGRLATVVSSLSLAVTLTAALCLPGTVEIVLVVVPFSLGFAFGSVAIPIITKLAFGMRDFGKINGFFVMMAGIAASFGPVFSGFVCDVTGSYAGSYIIYLALAIIFPTIIVICLPKKDKQFGTAAKQPST